ncbi:O-methyltransferase [Anaerobacillus sp. CMMVII]|uniref:O-methyltransferase n=1 Tax=Anaerobacillus sp. CMMVII TaxID=2755588 RepID=UPI0021B7CBDB|nr:O-methyltransferase [Anaerobacillus sp. CMMVII]MCT8139571.1 O-methyltransferase [Anaerobacillus sp. CMMVII]
MVSEQVNAYISSLIKARNPLLTEMEQYAREHEVPIMDIVSIEAMLQILSFAGTKKVLEVGTAIGYSAMRVAERLPHCKIVSIERDEDRYNKARDYIKRANLENRVTLIFGDALEVGSEIEQFGMFDCLFIDAAKGQYKRFFELYSPLVQPNGLVVSDNVLYKGIVAHEGKIAKGIRTMVTNLKSYNEMLMANEQFETTFYPIGDGMAISKKIGGVEL